MRSSMQIGNAHVHDLNPYSAHHRSKDGGMVIGGTDKPRSATLGMIETLSKDIEQTCHLVDTLHDRLIGARPEAVDNVNAMPTGAVGFLNHIEIQVSAGGARIARAGEKLREMLDRIGD